MVTLIDQTKRILYLLTFEAKLPIIYVYLQERMQIRQHMQSSVTKYMNVIVGLGEQFPPIMFCGVDYRIDYIF